VAAVESHALKPSQFAQGQIDALDNQMAGSTHLLVLLLPMQMRTVSICEKRITAEGDRSPSVHTSTP
jgi:hypothetical protein